tara:strand:- start:2615 stop:3334 length:720 start_codon:yes stop_codon:yes gene_type:complete
MTDKFERDWNLVQIDSGALNGGVLAELVRRGAAVVQDENDMKVDGLAGPNTISEIESQLGINQPQESRPLRGRRRSIPDLVPIPTVKGLEAVYGSPAYKSHPSKPGALILERDWVKKNIVKVTLHTGQYTYCHRLVADEMKRLYKQACDLTGYTPKKIWAWVARRKLWREDKGPSLHSYGIAFDIDSALNKYGMASGTPVHESRWFDIWEDSGWSWGGRWGNQETGKGCDPMHFERVRR